MFETVNDNKDIRRITKEYLNIKFQGLKILMPAYSSLPLVKLLKFVLSQREMQTFTSLYI